MFDFFVSNSEASRSWIRLSPEHTIQEGERGRKKRPVTSATRFVSSLLHQQEHLDGQIDQQENGRIRLEAHDEEKHSGCIQQD